MTTVATLLDVLRAEAAPAVAAGFTKDQLTTILRALDFQSEDHAEYLHKHADASEVEDYEAVCGKLDALVSVVQDLIDHPPTWDALLDAAVATPGQAQLRATYAAEIQRARDCYADNSLEIDEAPLVTEGGDGLWVSAWVRASLLDGSFTPPEDNG